MSFSFKERLRSEADSRAPAIFQLPIISELLCNCSGSSDEITLQPVKIAKLTPKTLFHVTEMRFSNKIIPKQFFHVIL